MKRMNEKAYLTELFVKAGLIAAIAATMLLPTAITANGTELALRTQEPRALHGQPPTPLPLPVIQNLEAMPWLTWARASKAAQLGALRSPLPPPVDTAHRPPMWSDGLMAAAPRASNG